MSENVKGFLIPADLADLCQTVPAAMIQSTERFAELLRAALEQWPINTSSTHCFEVTIRPITREQLESEGGT